MFEHGIISDEAPPRKYEKSGKLVEIAGDIVMLKNYSADGKEYDVTDEGGSVVARKYVRNTL